MRETPVYFTFLRFRIALSPLGSYFLLIMLFYLVIILLSKAVLMKNLDYTQIIILNDFQKAIKLINNNVLFL